jgi:hypothetical protein
MKIILSKEISSKLGQLGIYANPEEDLETVLIYLIETIVIINNKVNSVSNFVHNKNL